MKISVIVPVYSVESYLPACVESIRNQTYRTFELILVDDGGTDGCPALCDEYAREDDRVRVIHQQNGGLANARNAGIAAAAGDCLTFIDSDDFIGPQYLEQLADAMEKTGADVTAVDMVSREDLLEPGIGTDYVEFTGEEALEEILAEGRMTTSAWGKLLRAELFREIRFPDGKIYEDYGTIPWIFGKCGKVVLIPTAKYYYRVNPESITGVRFSQKRMQYFEISEQVTAYLQECYPALVPIAYRRATRYAISFYSQIGKSGFQDEEIQRFLIRTVRKNILDYCLHTRYSPMSKLYGVFLSVFPRLAKAYMGANGQ